MQMDAATAAVTLIQASGRRRVMCTRHRTLRSTDTYTRPPIAHIQELVGESIALEDPCTRLTSRNSKGTTKRSADVSCSRCCA